MNTTHSVERDERTVAVENASYRWAYLFLSFGLLVLAAVRSLMNRESPWDMLLLVILGGGVGTAYQSWHRVLSRHWVVSALLAAVAAAVLAAAVVWLRVWQAAATPTP